MREKEEGSQPLHEINHDYKAGHKIAPLRQNQDQQQPHPHSHLKKQLWIM